ncbi:MAG: hypothetical protein M5U07_10640 [Xanthobacteraceae bacterium]|nr:hypothetical protein [Xanthobacteraceae bacterium]
MLIGGSDAAAMRFGAFKHVGGRRSMRRPAVIVGFVQLPPSACQAEGGIRDVEVEREMLVGREHVVQVAPDRIAQIESLARRSTATAFARPRTPGRSQGPNGAQAQLGRKVRGLVAGGERLERDRGFAQQVARLIDQRACASSTCTARKSATRAPVWEPARFAIAARNNSQAPSAAPGAAGLPGGGTAGTSHPD